MHGCNETVETIKADPKSAAAMGASIEHEEEPSGSYYFQVNKETGESSSTYRYDNSMNNVDRLDSKRSVNGSKNDSDSK